MSAQMWYDSPQCPPMPIYPPDVTKLDEGTAEVKRICTGLDYVACHVSCSLTRGTFPWTGPASALHADTIRQIVGQIDAGLVDLAGMVAELQALQGECTLAVRAGYKAYEQAMGIPVS